MTGRSRRPSTLDRRRATLLWVALVAFCLAQAFAFAHATQHVGSDAAGLPGDHSQLCTDCASVLPLLAVAGGLGAAFALLRPVLRRLPLPRTPSLILATACGRCPSKAPTQASMSARRPSMDSSRIIYVEYLSVLARRHCLRCHVHSRGGTRPER
jgi:hypothetical protein